MGPKLLELEGTPNEQYQLELKLENMLELLAAERIKMSGALSKGVWCPELKKVEVTEKTGSHWDVFGHSDDSKLYLYPEEALYLLDVAAIEITFEDVPLSLHRAYILFLHNSGVSPDQYRVYSHLSLMGYNLQRHSNRNVLTKYEKEIEVHKIGLKVKTSADESGPPKKKKRRKEDLIKAGNGEKGCLPKIDSTDPDSLVLSKLRVISTAEFPPAEMDSTTLINYDVYVTNSKKGHFKKSTIQLPNFRLRIVSNVDPVPDISETCQLHNFFQDEVPIVYAVVFADAIQFMQLSPVALPTLL